MTKAQLMTAIKNKTINEKEIYILKDISLNQFIERLDPLNISININGDSEQHIWHGNEEMTDSNMYLRSELNSAKAVIKSNLKTQIAAIIDEVIDGAK